MSSHISLVCPQPYHITASNEIKQRARYKHIDTWSWVKLKDLLSFCVRVHMDVPITFGPPQYRTHWNVDGGCLALLRDFGLAMFGNEEIFKEPVYTYVRCLDEAAPTTADFCLESFPLPSEEDCQAGIIYVPAGWGKEVVRFIQEGVYLLKYNQDADTPMAYFTNGSVCSLNFLKQTTA